MALPDEALREEHAESAPIYVRAEGDAYALVETSTDVAISTHETPRAALLAALDLEAVAALVKRANLRSNGEPDGVWRWLDASAEEDEPIGDSRITAASLWDMAAGLNTRKSAIPINGGGAPTPEHAASEPHGDAYYGDGAHPANGWAHLGAIVVESDGRTHLYLYSELLPEVAREVDRGRLAYGSICFAYESTDEANGCAVLGASLISHALTNDPAVTTLTAGSERTNQTTLLAMRTRRADNMATKRTHSLDALRATARDASLPNSARLLAARAVLAVEKVDMRGALADLYERIASLLGVTPADLMASPWAVEDAMCDLKRGVAAEARLGEEGGEPAPEAPAPEPPPAPGMTAAERSRATRADAPEGEQSSDAPTPEEGMALLGLARAILSKPDVSAADAIAELEATKEQLAAALGQDAPADGDGGDAPAEAGEAAAEGEGEGDKARSALRQARTEAKQATEQLAAERAKVQRYETAEWLDAEIAKRQLAVPATEREELIADALEHGRAMVEKILRAKNAPPSGANPLDAVPDAKPAPTSITEAANACMDEARAALAARDPKAAKLSHLVRAEAQRMAKQRWPEFNKAGAKRTANAD